MLTYKVPLVPGPTKVPESVRRAYLTDFASPDLEPEYSVLYAEAQTKLGTILGTKNRMAIMTAEAIAGLWGALKSCIRTGDRVLAISTGVYGFGFGEMAADLGAEVRWVEFGYDEIIQADPVAEAIEAFRPKMVTAVHCETPSGTLNPMDQVGELVKQYEVPLFCVDAVASAGGVPVLTDEWGIDLCVVGTQKALSAFPDLAIVAVSDRAWEAAHVVDYRGYDALLPFYDALEKKWFPYTPAWAALEALNEACRLLLNEGLEKVFQRHLHAAERCRRRAQDLGLSLYPVDPTGSSPTVTALKVPEPPGWEELDRQLRQRGAGFGGSLGPLAGRVFRIGHMGTQADPDLVDRGLDLLAEILG